MYYRRLSAYSPKRAPSRLKAAVADVVVFSGVALFFCYPSLDIYVKLEASDFLNAPDVAPFERHVSPLVETSVA